MRYRPLLLLAATLATLSPPAFADSEQARKDYRLHCSGCHQADGSGRPENDIPDMRGSLSHFLRSAAGRQFLVQVPGTSQSALSNGEIASLLNWMLGRFSPGEIPAGFQPYSEAEVAAYRAQPLTDVFATRAAIVKEINAIGYPLR